MVKIVGNVNRAFWIGRGWTPLHIGLVLSEQAWNHEMKRLGVTHSSYPTTDASCTYFEAAVTNGHCCIVTINPDYTVKASVAQVVALLAHEAVHCKQYCFSAMGHEPDIETEAYYVQGVAQDLWYKLEEVTKKGKRK